MKKSLFFAFFVCAVLALVGCEQQNDPNKLTGITVTPSELSMVPGDGARLKVTAVPTTATLDETVVITWESSDTTVATVTDKGAVTAVGYGKANITATYGEYKAICSVWVKTYFESLVFTQAIVWDIDTTGCPIDTITASDSTEYVCYLANAELWLCADGFYVNESGYLDGGELASYIAVKAPMYYAPADLNPEIGHGTKFCLGEWALAELPEDSIEAQVGAPGQLNEEEYMAYMDMAVQYYNAGDMNMFYTALLYAGADPRTGSTSITGATMNTMQFQVTESNPEGGYYSSYIPDGIVTEGLLSLNAEGISPFMCGMDYNYLKFREFENTVYWWGCNWLENEDGTQLSWGDEKIMHWGEEVVYQLGELPTAEAARKLEPIHAPIMKIDYPEVAERIENQLKQRNTLVKK